MAANRTEIQKLIVSDDTEQDFFGYSISSVDDTALIGAPFDDSKGYNSGSVYVFSKVSANQPPVFGTPTPGNNSTNNPWSLSWSIQINDPEGDAFSWTIQCSNGQTTSGTGASNGTKSVTLSGLAYFTTYSVWVNATDPTGSGLYTRKWYTFTTKVNQPPNFGSTNPSNGSTNISVSRSWSIPINDPEGNAFSWTIQCSNGQTTSGTGASNGTKSLALSGLVYLTVYKVWVNATDPTGSGLYTRKWYTFTTRGNKPPIFGSPNPSNGSINNSVNLSWSIPINDPDGDAFSWTIQCSKGQVSSGTNVTNGTKSLKLSGLAYVTTYKVWVNATDPTGSGLYTRKWYTFTTRVNKPPIFGSPNPSNGSTNSTVNRSWSIPINDPDGDAFSWTIQCSKGQVSSGTNVTNGTKSLKLSGLVYLTVYKVWVNATDPTGSGLYTRKWYTFTTKVSLPPVFGTPSSANGSKNNSLSLSWSILINDSEGDIFSWTIHCSNGQTTSGNGASNGTKSIGLFGLTNSTTYKVWVNATDPTGSGRYTRKWYTFTTVSPPPSTPTIDGPASGKTGVSYNYNFVAVDPDGDDVYYRIEWGDGSPVTEWIGPYHSGQLVIVSHTFMKRGILIIKCQAKDSYDALSNWGQLKVTMPKGTAYIPSLFLELIERFMARFPHAFPILRQLLEY